MRSSDRLGAPGRSGDKRIMVLTKCLANGMNDHHRRREVKIIFILVAFCIAVSILLGKPLPPVETWKSRKSETALPTSRRLLTLLVPLSGELGNHLHWISTAYRIKWHLERTFPLEIQIVGEHQSHRKWKHAQQDIQNCFVNLKPFEFEAGRHSSEFQLIRKHQREFIQHHPGEFSITDSGADCQGLFDCAERRAELTMKTWTELDEDSSGNASQLLIEGSNYSLPFLVLREMDGPSIKHEEEPIRALLKINMTNPFCCAALPKPNEFVFHLRNFGVESNGRLPARDVSFQELSPQQLALLLTEAVGTNRNTTSVAIVSRFPEDDHTREYQVALTAAGFRTRIVFGQTGIQDFCFMLHSRSELFGSLTSTYVWWAAELGNMSATLYSMAINNEISFSGFATSVEPHQWRVSKQGSRIRHIPNIPIS